MEEDNKKIFIFAAIIIAAFLFAWAVVSFVFPKDITAPWSALKFLSRPGAEPSQLPFTSNKTSPAVSQKAWFFTLTGKQLLFSGGYAYPSLVKLTDGRYLMYLAKRNRGTFILGSINAFSWYRTTDVIFPGVEMARALNFDGGVRIYYPKTDDGIASSFSTDGVNRWSAEATHIDAGADDRLNSPTIIKLEDGAYRMFFSKVGEIYGATSRGGMNWESDIVPTVSSPAFYPFVINWTNPVTKKPGYLMLYNADLNIIAAYSPDGFEWQGLGDTGIIGAGISAINTQGGLRVYYSDLAIANGVVYTGILNTEYK